MSHHFHACTEACARCAQECKHCADACLDEPNVKELIECVRLNRDSAAICWVAASFMSCGSSFALEICRVCAEICDACGAECEKHELDHCQRCAEACRHCEEECRRTAGATV
jgi:hypothetical protein